ncbi:MAG: hypothetical protein JNK05_34830 [Myxococcales bacterium]|nr:hypothetical protein [Myxococcales bacterium]
MTIRRPVPVPPEEAIELSGAILDRAIERAKLTNAVVATAIGYGEHGESKIREMRAGTRAFTLVHYARATASCPRLARALLAEMGAAIEPDSDATPAVHAVQELGLSALDLARVSMGASLDGVITHDEGVAIRAQCSRVTNAIEKVERALVRVSAARPVV